MNLAKYWKAVLAFFGSGVGNAVVTWVASGQPWPTNNTEWLQWLVTILGTTGLVAVGPSNKVAAKPSRA